MEKDNFLKGAAVLGIAGALVKILGAFYRIPLGNILKTEGMGYYQTAYPLYLLLLTLSTAGFPVAIAKLVSEKRALGDYKGAHKVFRVAFIGLFLGGLLTSIFVAFNGKNIVTYLGNENAYYSLLGLLPALFFVPMMAAIRGYFQGQQKMEPTAVSQIAEQFFRVTLGIFFTYKFLDSGIPQAAGGASLGGSIGAVAGMLVMIVIYIKSKNRLREEFKNSKGVEESVGEILKELLAIAVPITIGSAIVPIMNTIDTSMVLKILQGIGYTKLEANNLYGQMTGFAQTLINLPQVFSMALAMSIVPAISEAFVREDREEIKNISSSSIRITLLIGLPCAFGLFILSRPIIELLYFKNTAETITSIGNLLSIMSFGVIFLTLVQSLTAILQGLGKPMVPVRNLFIGAIVKVVLTYTLTAIPSINIKGAAFSTVMAYFIAAILNIISVKKYARVKFNLKDIFIKPLISALGMMITAKVSYLLFLNIVGGKLATVLAIGLAGICYLILLFITGSITYQDFKLLPKGDKIGRKLVEKRILKEK